MLGGNGFGVIEIRDGAGNAQDAIVSTRGKIHAADGHLERPFAAFIKGAQRAKLRRRNLRIVEARPTLSLACFFDPIPLNDAESAAAFAALSP